MLLITMQTKMQRKLIQRKTKMQPRMKRELNVLLNKTKS